MHAYENVRIPICTCNACRTKPGPHVFILPSVVIWQTLLAVTCDACRGFGLLLMLQSTTSLDIGCMIGTMACVYVARTRQRSCTKVSFKACHQMDSCI